MNAWVLVAISMVGTFFNARQQRVGFLFWIVGNVGWVAYSLSIAQTAQAVMFAVYLALAVYGWIQWGRKRCA